MSPDVIAWLGGGVSATFVALALWHFYMAVGGLSSGAGGAVPSVAGKPVFVPSTGSTVAVGTVLLMFAAVAATNARSVTSSTSASSSAFAARRLPGSTPCSIRHCVLRCRWAWPVWL
jgi:hypothetical protein